MHEYNCQNICYMIVYAFIGFVVALPIPDEQSDAHLGPTTTTAAAEHALLETQMSEMSQQNIVQDFNTFIVLEPMLDAANPLEFNQRLRRALTQSQLNEPVDVDYDMELAEVHVFRPLFRYRAEVERRAQRNG
ncbi:uncharacterized protein LOC105218656 [Zeugodacus cucurbitae]|uniref:Acetyl-coenzyme A carboxylase carboxyl transferase subunit beta n=1 Tax=Zeugodacus cucurbitae TaxID=28588 RepID=A0A0A1XJN9_ZEUCU|nr:uncharacterized protein LOC105218656 [Zeugodacus cucurbitae]